MSRFLPALLAATNLVSAAPALAQEVLAPVIPGPSQAFDWSGFYLGIFAGGAAGEFDGASSGEGDPTDTATITSIGDGNGEIDYGEFSLDDESWLGGGNVGFNVQNGRLVFGAVGDVAATNLQGSQSFYVSEYDNVPNFPTDLEGIGGDIAMSLEWLSTIRGLIGMTSPDGRFLFFLTGGLAIGGFESALGLNFVTQEELLGGGEVGTFDVSIDPDDYLVFDDDESTEVGLAVGGGVGALITPNLSLDLTYLFVHFDEISANFDVDEIIVGAADAEFSAHLGRVGVSYRFGGGLPPP